MNKRGKGLPSNIIRPFQQLLEKERTMNSKRQNCIMRIKAFRWSRLSLLAIATVLGIVLVVGVVLAAAVTIDTFDDGSQYVSAGPNLGNTGNGYTAVSGIGGERDVYIYNSTGGGFWTSR